jgi:hypothetical protein
MSEGALSQASLVGSKERHPMKKEATPKRKGLKSKTTDKKGGNPKMQGTQKKDNR